MTVTHKPLTAGNSLASSSAVRYTCDTCATDITLAIRIKCAECEEIDLCGSCFCAGKEVGRHLAGHAYRVVEQHAYPIFTPDWGADEELLLLEALQKYGMGNWVDVAEHIGFRSKEETEKHYHEVYLSSENLMPPLSVDWTLSQQDFQQSKKERLTELRAMPPPAIPPIPAKPLTSAPANHEIGGFMPGRLEFEHEIDQEAETSIKDLEFGRVFAYGGDSQPDPPPAPPKDPGSEEETAEQAELRVMEAEALEEEDEEEREMKLQLLSVYNDRLARRTRGKNFILDRGLVEHRKIQANERKRPKDERDFLNRLKTFAKLQTATDYESFVDGLLGEIVLRKRIAELQEYRRMGITSFADSEKYEKEKQARASYRPMPARESTLQTTPVPSYLADRHVQRSRSNANLTEDLESRESTPKPGTSKKHLPASTLTLSSASSFYLLSEKEQIMCSELKILPKPYFVMKHTLMSAVARSGGRLTRAQVRSLLEGVDEEKVYKVWDHLVDCGWGQTALPAQDEANGVMDTSEDTF